MNPTIPFDTTLLDSADEARQFFTQMGETAGRAMAKDEDDSRAARVAVISQQYLDDLAAGGKPAKLARTVAANSRRSIRVGPPAVLASLVEAALTPNSAASASGLRSLLIQRGVAAPLWLTRTPSPASTPTAAAGPTAKAEPASPPSPSTPADPRLCGKGRMAGDDPRAAWPVDRREQLCSGPDAASQWPVARFRRRLHDVQARRRRQVDRSLKLFGGAGALPAPSLACRTPSAVKRRGRPRTRSEGKAGCAVRLVWRAGRIGARVPPPKRFF